MAKAPIIKTVLGIDFETANRTRASASSLGICMIDYASGEMIEKKNFLINPETDFDHFNSMLTGITPVTVKDAPAFPAVLPEIVSRVNENTLVVAHNAAFDMSVLRRSCERYGCSFPELNYFCTYIMAKAFLPGLASYSLTSVAEKCGVPTMRHHVSDDDAEMCARIFMAFARECGGETVWQINRRIGIMFGSLFADGTYCSCHKTRCVDLSAPIVEEADKETEPEAPVCVPENSPFTGKTVVFTGALNGMTRAEAERLVEAAGGIIGKGVTKKTNFIICGYQDPKMLNGHEKSSKLLKAETLAAAGQDIQILVEDEFFTMI